jgi:hypothetical protein
MSVRKALKQAYKVKQLTSVVNSHALSSSFDRGFKDVCTKMYYTFFNVGKSQEMLAFNTNPDFYQTKRKLKQRKPPVC